MSSSFVGYGELLLRMTPKDHGSLIIQSDLLQKGYAGAEANILCDLAHWGHTADFVSAFPPNPLGRGGEQFLNMHGVSSKYTFWDDGRMGSYFIEHGTSIRGTKVTYDRKYSSVTQCVIKTDTWNEILSNAEFFIITGITPALSQICQENLRRALEVAKTNEVKVVFDLNFRRTLWNKNKAKKSFDSILPFVDILIGNIGSAYDVFDIPFGEISDFESLKKVSWSSLEQLDELGNFEAIGMTLRLQKGANKNVLGGLLKIGPTHYYSNPIPTEIVDRLGGGDAFVAGMLHGMINSWDHSRTINFATASFAVTQTLHGDINYCTEEEIESIAGGNTSGYVKR
jgi:2-dehydro-3-deoxygluconokinase